MVYLVYLVDLVDLVYLVLLACLMINILIMIVYFEVSLTFGMGLRNIKLGALHLKLLGRLLLLRGPTIELAWLKLDGCESIILGWV